MPLALIQDGDRWLRFESPEDELVAREPGEVMGVLRRADAALASGAHVAGSVSYEAARGLGLPTRDPEPDGPPLVWLGVFGPPEAAEAPRTRAGAAPPPLASWQPGLGPDAHAAALARIREHLAAGDTYQVNLTFPLEAPLGEEPFALFARLVAAQRSRHGAFVDLGRFAIASATPELFFRRRGRTLTARPMKGTARRGPTAAEDARLAERLRTSAKERAENLMIVDMLRNDLGRVADTGSVEVPSLFAVERYPTLLQMTSEVTARSDAPLSRLVEALFPCASITGAPKRRTMEIIASLEPGPRGPYTGAVGWAGPGGETSWGVAIRTAVADRKRGRVRFDVGSGIVADSETGAEYAECLLKARVLEEEPFELLETLLWAPGEGYRRLEGHLVRLGATARHFGFGFEAGELRRALDAAAASLRAPAVVRLLVDAAGRARCETRALEPLATPLRVAVARSPVDRDSIWLHHKTTRRQAYETAAAARPDCDDVLLWNAAGELTEATRYNAVVDRPDGRVTPPIACGLLAGVERDALLAAGRVREAVVSVSELRPGTRLTLVNSVRGEAPAIVV